MPVSEDRNLSCLKTEMLLVKPQGHCSGHTAGPRCATAALGDLDTSDEGTIDTVVRLADSMVVPPGELLDGISWVPAPEVVGDFAFGSMTISLSPRQAKQKPTE
jgi:hypothetical protein